MEFPDTTQYLKDPLATDFEQYQGLKSVNVSSRFSFLLWTGFIIEILILVMILANLALSNKLLVVSNLLGYLSFIWFITLLFYRFDHYGKVCSGDFANDQ